MDEKLLNIREAAEILGISIDTLRRWDKSGKLKAIRKEGGTHRYYRQKDLEVFSSNLIKLANDWATESGELPAIFYCANSAVFQARLIKMQNALIRADVANTILSLIVAVAGEIGNNSFDHNLGQWPDVPGIFFGYDIHKKQIVLADRGLGIFTTLSRVKLGLKNHLEALKVAFTEIISGRAPEERGNGLKFVRQVIAENPISLFFETGDGELRIKKESSDLIIIKTPNYIRGCLAVIEF